MRSKFDGDDIVAERDDPRLSSQLEKIKKLVLDGKWRSLKQISEATKAPHASVSAQLRNLRKRKFGAYEVQRRHVDGGFYQYRVLKPVKQMSLF